MRWEASGLGGVDPRKLVADYYRLVDAGDVDGLVALFEPTVTYDRPGCGQIIGRAELDRFYRSQDVVGSRAHTLSKVVCEGRDIAVHGKAEVTRDGRQTTVYFADFFTVSDAGLFEYRRTFF